jgi:hypothetical protein
MNHRILYTVLTVSLLSTKFLHKGKSTHLITTQCKCSFSLRCVIIHCQEAETYDYCIQNYYNIYSLSVPNEMQRCDL